MSARPCPKCKQPLEIPQPPPAKVQCPKCSAVLRLGPPPSPASQGGARGGAASKSKPELAISRHDLAGKALPQEENPFDLDAEEGQPSAPARRRKSGAGLLLLSLAGLVLLGAGVLLYFLLQNKQPNPDKGPDFSNLDKKNVPVHVKQEQINASIARGVDFLKKQASGSARLYHRATLADVAPANAHIGAAALTGLTLLECGVPAEDAAVQQVAQTIREGAGQIYATYTLATAILFLDRLYQNTKVPDSERLKEGVVGTSQMLEKDRLLLQTFAARLMACQEKSGFWGYGKKVTPQEEEETLKTLQAGKFAGTELSYRNLSNSQFAALALWAARRHRVPVRPSLQAVAKAARETQKPEGTWYYDHNLPMKHSSVCAGLIFLALERGLEEEGPRSGANAKDPKVSKGILSDPAVAKGLNYLGAFVAKPPYLPQKKRDARMEYARRVKDYFEKYELHEGQTDKLPPVSWDMDLAFSGTIIGADSWGDLYLLWSIERVAVIYDLAKIGNKDWYSWGVDVILANQKEDGGWEDRFPGVPDTCFALLFLKRANIVKDLTEHLRGSSNPGNVSAPPTPEPAPPTRKKE